MICADTCRYIWRCSHLVVELAVDRLPILVHHLECVRSVAIHVAIAIRNATVTEQDGHLWKQEREEEMKARREKSRPGMRRKRGGKMNPPPPPPHTHTHTHNQSRALRRDECIKSVSTCIETTPTWWVVSAQRVMESQNMSGSCRKGWGEKEEEEEEEERGKGGRG